jgi:hypothetical protein
LQGIIESEDLFDCMVKDGLSNFYSGNSDAVRPDENTPATSIDRGIYLHYLHEDCVAQASLVHRRAFLAKLGRTKLALWIALL